ncbi:MAG: helix-turn-helix domain-containing protein [Burkholderiales bacterium]|nr:helix-turn-helix domain-containing protein [Burkholderiales bacterium]
MHENAQNPLAFPLAGAFLYVRIDQAVGMFGIGRTSLYKAFLCGELKRFKIGRRTLIKVSELQQWIDLHADAACASVER